MSAHETGQAPLITNSIPEQELDRFLDRVPVKKTIAGWIDFSASPALN